MFFFIIGFLSIISCNGIIFNDTLTNYLGHSDNYIRIDSSIGIDLNSSLNKYLGYINYTGYREPDYLTIEHLARDILHNRLHSSNELPTSIDYRNIDNINYITPVKYQHTCGACVSFAAIAVLETQYKLKGQSLDLSEKDLFFCKGQRKCTTGWYLYDVSIVLKHHKISEEKYCPYFEDPFTCSESCYPYGLYNIEDFYYINNFNEMKHWLHKNGTLLTRMNVYRDFFQYDGGIYEKNSDVFIGGHAVAVIGYNDDEGYWICKNSWGQSWGENGFFRIKYGESGIMPYAYGYQVSNIPEPYVINKGNIRSPTIILYLLILNYI